MVVEDIGGSGGKSDVGCRKEAAVGAEVEMTVVVRVGKTRSGDCCGGRSGLGGSTFETYFHNYPFLRYDHSAAVHFHSAYSTLNLEYETHS